VCAADEGGTNHAPIYGNVSRKFQQDREGLKAEVEAANTVNSAEQYEREDRPSEPGELIEALMPRLPMQLVRLRGSHWMTKSCAEALYKQTFQLAELIKRRTAAFPNLTCVSCA